MTEHAAKGDSIRIHYVPRTGLLRLSLLNALLFLLTLTLYRFWARTNVRRHIWSCVHINGEPLEYTGKGIELFKGAMFVFLVFGLPTVLAFAGLTLAFGPEHPSVIGLQLLVFLAISLLWGAAIYRARRYQLSRTLWRGIRGALLGSTTTYALLYFGSIMARAMTFGWITPVMNLTLQQQMMGSTFFGDRPFRFKGPAGPLYPAYALCWFVSLLVIAVLGGLLIAEFTLLESEGFWASLAGEQGGDPGSPDQVSIAIGVIVVSLAVFYLLYLTLYPAIWAMYTARELIQFATYTSFDGAQFRFDATTGSIIRLAIGNALLSVLTLGVAAPFVQQRLVRYLCDRVRIEGTVNIDRIRQSRAPVSSMGEGLADALDVGGL
jgi:uncharacterized membrane protein YjgN (DUF898 family)